MNNFFYILLSFLAVMFLMSSCATHKDIPYFQDIQNSNRAKLENTAPFVEPTIQPDDILNISIFTLDPATGIIVNQSQTTSTVGGNMVTTGAVATGFLVDRNGEIELVSTGKIKVGGLTTFEARELVRAKISVDYKNPSVQVRFANFKVSILGEVNTPSTYTLPNERVTILDAISLAGDLTIYGRRENVLVIRDNNGKKEYQRLNLNSSEIFSNPFFYLKQNDVIYVEPNKRKVSASNSGQIQTISLIGSLVSVLLIAISTFKK